MTLLLVNVYGKVAFSWYYYKQSLWPVLSEAPVYPIAAGIWRNGEAAAQ